MQANVRQNDSSYPHGSMGAGTLEASIAGDAYRLRSSPVSLHHVAIAVISLWIAFYAIGFVSTLLPKSTIPDSSAMAESNVSAEAGSLTEALVTYAKRDYTRAAELFTALAISGDAVAQLKLGEMHAAGRGVARNDPEAVKWFTRSAEQGELQAQYRLGLAILEGRGREKNPELGLRWLRRAAEGGVPHALNAIGEFHVSPGTNSRRPSEAITWFKCAARMGNPKALYNLGVLYAAGRDVPQDLVEALKWFELSSDASLGQARDMANRNLAAIRGQISPMQVQDAKRLAEDWSHGTETACTDLLVAGS